MMQNYGTFHIEKMIQYRQAEMNKKIRAGLYIREIVSGLSNHRVQSRNQRSLWHKWFSSRRLNTSWK